MSVSYNLPLKILFSLKKTEATFFHIFKYPPPTPAFFNFFSCSLYLGILGENHLEAKEIKPLFF